MSRAIHELTEHTLPPTLDTATQAAIKPGAKGAGGLGGNADADMNHGADGVSAAQQVFP